MSRHLVALVTVPVALVCLLGCQPVEDPGEAPYIVAEQGDEIDFEDGAQLLRVEVVVDEGPEGCSPIEVDLRWHGTDGVAAELRPDAGDGASEVYDVVLEDAELVPMAPLSLSVRPAGDGLCLGEEWVQAQAEEGAGWFTVAPREEHRGATTWVHAELLD